MGGEGGDGGKIDLHRFFRLFFAGVNIGHGGGIDDKIRGKIAYGTSYVSGAGEVAVRPRRCAKEKPLMKLFLLHSAANLAVSAKEKDAIGNHLLDKFGLRLRGFAQ